jgi:hypothetical protein
VPSVLHFQRAAFSPQHVANRLMEEKPAETSAALKDFFGN